MGGGSREVWKTVTKESLIRPIFHNKACLYSKACLYYMISLAYIICLLSPSKPTEPNNLIRYNKPKIKKVA